MKTKYFTVGGDELNDGTHKAIRKGDTLHCKHLPREEWCQCAAIVYLRGRGCILANFTTDTDTAILSFSHPAFKSFQINAADIVAVYEVEAVQRQRIQASWDMLYFQNKTICPSKNETKRKRLELRERAAREHYKITHPVKTIGGPSYG